MVQTHLKQSSALPYSFHWALPSKSQRLIRKYFAGPRKGLYVLKLILENIDKNLDVKCYILGRVGWTHERTMIKIGAFCLKHFGQSCHMRLTFAKRVCHQKSTFRPKHDFSRKWPRSVWEWSGGIPDLLGPIFKPFLLKSIIKYSHVYRKSAEQSYYKHK